MRKLSKYEKETIINWNETENLASVYTFNASLKRRLADFSRKYPLLCRLERSTPEGSVTYVLDKSRLSIRLVPPYSEERKAAAREYAKEHGFQAVSYTHLVFSYFRIQLIVSLFMINSRQLNSSRTSMAYPFLIFDK